MSRYVVTDVHSCRRQQIRLYPLLLLFTPFILTLANNSHYRRIDSPTLSVSGEMSTQWPQRYGDGSSPPSPRQMADRERHSLVDDQFSASTPPSPSTAQPPVPNTPMTSHLDSPLLGSAGTQERAPSRSLSSPNFISSPLNPRGSSATATAVPSPWVQTPRTARPGSRTSSMHLNRMASEETAALGGSITPFGSLAGGTRGSMVLYRLVNEDEHGALLPPKMPNRDSTASSSGDSIFSLSSDSKYPSGAAYGQRGLVPYAYDPAVDDKEPPDEEDIMHDPSDMSSEKSSLALRGFLNVGVLLLLILALIILFVFYPVLSYYRNYARNLAIDGNIRINGTGQAPVL